MNGWNSDLLRPIRIDRRSLTALQAPSPAALATEAKAIAVPHPLLDITILEVAWSYIAPKTTHKYSTALAVISYLADLLVV